MTPSLEDEVLALVTENPAKLTGTADVIFALRERGNTATMGEIQAAIMSLQDSGMIVKDALYRGHRKYMAYRVAEGT